MMAGSSGQQELPDAWLFVPSSSILLRFTYRSADCQPFDNTDAGRTRRTQKFLRLKRRWHISLRGVALTSSVRQRASAEESCMSESRRTIAQLNQLAPEDSNRSSAERNPVLSNRHSDDPAPLRRLERRHLCFAQHVGPVGTESAVGRSRDGIFIDPHSRSEKARDEVVSVIIGLTGDHNAPSGDLFQLAEIGAQ